MLSTLSLWFDALTKWSGRDGTTRVADSRGLRPMVPLLAIVRSGRIVVRLPGGGQQHAR
jgi:hypothetical protein